MRQSRNSMAHPYFDQKVFWITGASSGIGKAVALEAARMGSKLILSARNEEALNAVADQCRSLGVEARVLPFDLTEIEGHSSIAQKAISLYGHVDMLFNNGGISQRSLASETPLSIDRKVMEIDFFSHVSLTKAILPHLLERNSGHIIANSSITGIFGFPLRSAYSAAKHAIHGFFESLRAELASTGVKVTIIAPGRIATEISKNAILKDGSSHGKMDEGLAAGMPPEKCAQQILKAVRKNRPEAVIGGKETLMVTFRRKLPFVFFRLVSKVKPT